MLDLSLQPQKMQRTKGQARVSLRRHHDHVVLKDLHQSGSAKIMLPKVHNPVPEVVFLNTSGGVTGGDRLGYALTVGVGAQAVATTQTAERAYQSSHGTGEISIDLAVEQGAGLDWLPQETILFDRCNIRRNTTIDLAADAQLLMVEAIVLGRAAMGETVQAMQFRDLRLVRRAGRPVWIDPVHIDTDTLERRDHPALFGGARAMASIALIAPDAEDALEPLRQMLCFDGVTAAASAWDGRCIVRLLAQDAWPLRQAIAKILTKLRGCDLPRVWQI